MQGKVFFTLGTNLALIGRNKDKLESAKNELAKI